MEKVDVTIARIYLAESGMRDLLTRLHDVEKVKGVTAFRGIAGFGKSGKVRTAGLLDMSLELPVVVEFFDTPQRVDEILAHLEKDFEPGHIVQWPAKVSA